MICTTGNVHKRHHRSYFRICERIVNTVKCLKQSGPEKVLSVKQVGQCRLGVFKHELLRGALDGSQYGRLHLDKLSIRVVWEGLRAVGDPAAGS